MLTGGLGADVFEWTLAARGVSGTPSVDRVTDFDTASVASAAMRWICAICCRASNTSATTRALCSTTCTSHEQSGGNTIVHVSSNGGFTGRLIAPAKEDVTITSTGVNLFSGGLKPTSKSSRICCRRAS